MGKSLSHTAEEYLALERTAGTASTTTARLSRCRAEAQGIRPFRSISPSQVGTRSEEAAAGPSADLQVRVSSLTYTYPELSLVCGKPILADERQDVLLNPTVIFEVLSPSTAVYDRGIKLQHLGISRLSGPPARICGSNDRSFACIEFQPA